MYCSTDFIIGFTSRINLQNRSANENTVNEPELSAWIEQKAELLVSIIAGYGRVVVALSGGVDSAVVAKAAALGCGDRALAVTSSSPSLALGELESAQQLAESIGLRHEVIFTKEFSVAGYQQNAGDRCYYCKSELYDLIEEKFPQWDADVICNGANLDDLGDHRPGMQAARESCVRSPLIEAEISKQTVRALAKHWQLDVWDKPAMPCLSSRVAYGVEVTPERVQWIDAAERFLKETFSLRELRVRYEENDLARIEVPTESVALLVQSPAREQIVSKFREIGFRYVTVDLEGFRSGSLNQVLDIVELQINIS